MLDHNHIIAFCQVTAPLPDDIKRSILNIIRSETIGPPNAPVKKISPRLRNFMDRWAARGEQSRSPRGRLFS